MTNSNIEIIQDIYPYLESKIDANSKNKYLLKSMLNSIICSINTILYLDSSEFKLRVFGLDDILELKIYKKVTELFNKHGYTISDNQIGDLYYFNAYNNKYSFQICYNLSTNNSYVVCWNHASKRHCNKHRFNIDQIVSQSQKMKIINKLKVLENLSATELNRLLELYSKIDFNYLKLTHTKFGTIDDEIKFKNEIFGKIISL